MEPVLGVGDTEMSQNCWWDTKILSWGLSLPPQPCDTYLAARGTEGAIGGDSHRVQVARVPNVVSLQLAVSQIPNLGGQKNTGAGGGD